MTIDTNQIKDNINIFDKAKDIVYIKDEKNNELKSVVIPAQYIDIIKDELKTIESKISTEDRD